MEKNLQMHGNGGIMPAALNHKICCCTSIGFNLWAAQELPPVPVGDQGVAVGAASDGGDLQQTCLRKKGEEDLC